jgi:hypothetical protein
MASRSGTGGKSSESPGRVSRAESLGLRLRVDREGRRISSQHRQLDLFYSLVAAALERGSRRELETAFGRFQDALESHFDLEDRLYFPALHGLRPRLDAELAQLVREHTGFRDTLHRLGELFRKSPLKQAVPALDAFVSALCLHEGREEKLLEDLDLLRDEG